MIPFSMIMVIVAGLLVGLLLGITGGGGSILTVPLLVYGVGLEAKTAIATSLVIVGTASLAALIVHSRAGHVRWQLGIRFGLAGMVGAAAGGWLAQFIADPVLLLLFSGVMIACALAMLRKRECVEDDGGNAAIAAPGRSAFRVIGDGVLVGLVTGVVGAGGGFLIVPALTLLGGLPMRAAVGTSLLVIAMNCLAGLAGHVAHVEIDVRAAVIVGSCAIAGTLLGSRLAGRLSGPQLQRCFGLFVLVIAAILIVIEGSQLLARTFGVERWLAGSALVILEAMLLLPTIRRCVDVATTPQIRR